MEDYININSFEIDLLENVEQFKKFFYTLVENYDELSELDGLKEYLLETERHDCYMVVKHYEDATS
jgi:hypothetical protein